MCVGEVSYVWIFEPYLLTDVDCQYNLGLAFQAENFPYPLRFCLNRNRISSGHFHVLLFIYECACILQLGWEWSTFFFKMCMCQCLTVYTIYIPPWAHWIQPLGEIYFWERYTTSNYIKAECALLHLLAQLLTIIKKGTPVLLWSTRIEFFAVDKLRIWFHICGYRIGGVWLYPCLFLFFSTIAFQGIYVVGPSSRLEEINHSNNPYRL